MSSGLSTPSPNAERTLLSNSSGSPIAGRCIDRLDGGDSALRCVVVMTLKKVDGCDAPVFGWAIDEFRGNNEVSISSISSSSSFVPLLICCGVEGLLEGDEDEVDSALAARAAAIFCANLDNGLAGLLVSRDVGAAGGVVGGGTVCALLSEACFDAAARRRCSANMASFDLGLAASPEGPGLALTDDEGPGDDCPATLAGL